MRSQWFANVDCECKRVRSPMILNAERAYFAGKQTLVSEASQSFGIGSI